MRIKYHKEIEFFLKNNFLTERFFLKKRLERSIKNNDEQEINLIRDFISPGTDSIDIGVYRGVYSYEMSKYSKVVHSFEPNPILLTNIKINLKKIIKNINFYNCALSNKEGLVSLRVPIRNKDFNRKNYEEYFQMGKASIHNENRFDDFEVFNVECQKLDNFNFSNKISFIKIDVEGHETEVIKGSEKTIKNNKPILLVEIEEQYTNKKVTDTLRYINSLGYSSFYFYNNKLLNTNNLSNLNTINNFIFKPL
jgi:FkbM family methyltransferase